MTQPGPTVTAIRCSPKQTAEVHESYPSHSSGTSLQRAQRTRRALDPPL